MGEDGLPAPGTTTTEEELQDTLKAMKDLKHAVGGQQLLALVTEEVLEMLVRDTIATIRRGNGILEEKKRAEILDITKNNNKKGVLAIPVHEEADHKAQLILLTVEKVKARRAISDKIVFLA